MSYELARAICLKSRNSWKEPLYIEIRDLLAARIAAGVRAPDATRPIEQDLTAEFAVCPGTFARRRGGVITLKMCRTALSPDVEGTSRRLGFNAY
jgi:hypothetical protein